MWFFGFNWSDMIQPDDTIGAAIGRPQNNNNESTDPFAWEAYYAFKPNDSMEHRTTFGGKDKMVW